MHNVTLSNLTASTHYYYVFGDPVRCRRAPQGAAFVGLGVKKVLSQAVVQGCAMLEHSCPMRLQRSSLQCSLGAF